MTDIDSDYPLENEADDRLARRALLNVAVDRLQELVQSGRSATVAIIGEWGCGKTSFLNFLESRLRNEGWTIVWFNPWELSTPADLMPRFLAAVSAGLPGKSLRKARSKLAEYGDSLSPLLGLSPNTSHPPPESGSSFLAASVTLGYGMRRGWIAPADAGDYIRENF